MAKRNRIDKKQLQILIDTTQGVDQLGYLQEQYKRLAQEVKSTDSAMTARALERQMTVLKDKIQDVREELGLEGMTVNQLRQYYRQLDQESRSSSGALRLKAKADKEAVLDQIDALNEGTSRRERQEKKLNDELQKSLKANKLTGLSLDQLKMHHRNLTQQIQTSADFEGRLNQQRIREAQKVQHLITSRQNAISGAGGLIGQIKSNMPAAIAGAFGGLTVGIFDQALQQIKRLADEGLEYIQKKGRAVSEIQNILLVERPEANQIFEQLSKINTERSREELKELVLVAGDLNIAVDDVQAFVTAADKLEKVFSRDFEGVGNASTEIAKLKDTFAETKDMGIEDSFRSIGSALKVLNDEGPATTKGMTEFVARIGQLPDAFKPAITDAAALAAVFEEANISAQISSGGITNVLLTASKYGEEFGSMFSMAKDEFLSWMSQDPIGFLTEFAQGLKDMDESKIGEVFKTLHIESQESVKTLGTLSNNLDKFYQKQTVAAKAFKEASRIEEIFQTFNTDEKGTLDRAKKRIGLFFRGISEGMGRAMEQVIIDFAGGIDVLNKKTEEELAALEERAKRYAVTQGIIKTEALGGDAFANYGSGLANGGLPTPKNRGFKLPGNDTGNKADQSRAEQEKKRLEDLAATRIENEAKVLQEIYRMNLEAIEDELKQKEALILNDLENEAEQRRKLIAEQKLSLSDFNKWHEAAAAEAERKISELIKEKAKATAEEKAELENKVKMMTLETALQIAEDGEDQESILAAQMVLRRAQFEIDIEKAKAEEKQAIYERYLADIAGLDGTYRAKVKAEADEDSQWWLDFHTKEAERERKIKEDKEAQLKEVKLDFAYAAEEAIFGIISNRLEAEYNNKQAAALKELEALETQRKQGLLTEEAYTTAKTALEKKHDREMAEMKRKQAIADKAAALTQIAINTALAVTKVLSQTGVAAPAVIPLIIGTGAVQATVVASKPIPSYYFGGNTGPEYGNLDSLGGKMAIVHPNEEIIPAAVTQTPAFAALKPMIESIGGASAGGKSQTAKDSISVDFADLPEVLAKLNMTIGDLSGKLKNLKVYLGGTDLERLTELLQEFETQQNDSLIDG